MKCQHCHDGILKHDSFVAKHWDGFAQIPIDCDGCGKVSWISNETIGVNYYSKPKIKIPKLTEDTVIYVVNKEHPRWLQPAIIVKRDHMHYRLLFTDQLQIWMPEHWVKEAPSQML